MQKPKVVFPLVEAGMGHIIPSNSIANAFEKKYGKYTEVSRPYFFKDSGDKALIKMEQSFVKDVIRANKHTSWGMFETFMMDITNYKVLQRVFSAVQSKKMRQKLISRMESFRADLVLNTHISTALIAKEVTNNKPIITVYNPDVMIQPFYHGYCDMVMVSSERGYNKVMGKYGYNSDNLKLVPFPIREEAFNYSKNKKENLKRLGLEDKLTIVLFEGGYGLGKIKKICRRLLKTDLDANVVAICGKNEKLYNDLKKLKMYPNIKFVVEGFCPCTLDYLAAADIFMGKSGASSVAEPAFFGVAEIITKHATTIEKNNSLYYVEDVKCALNVLNPSKAVKTVKKLDADRALLKKMQDNALAIHDRYGSEEIADHLWDLLCKKYPDLKVQYDIDNKK